MIQSSEVYKRIVDEELIDLFAYEYIRNPEVIKLELESSFTYAQAVESEISESAGIVRTLIPNMSEELSNFFVTWETQEARHGQVQANILEYIRSEALPHVSKESFLIKSAGVIAKYSPGFHDIAETTVLIYAALGEKETQIAYRKLNERLNALGEKELSLRLMIPMAKQESLHLSYYRSAIYEKKDYLKPWQLSFISKYIEKFYQPVGVQRKNAERMKGFGKMALELSEYPLELASQTQELAEIFFGINVPKRPFIINRYQECVEKALSDSRQICS